MCCGSRAPVKLVNVPADVNVIDVLAAVALRVPIESGDPTRRRVEGRGSPGQLGEVVVHPSGTRVNIQLVDVPIDAHKVDVLAVIASRVTIQGTARSRRGALPDK